MYAAAAGTVTLLIHAGDSVTKDQLLARIESPELDNELKREQSTLEQLQAEVARQRILAQKARLLAQRDADAAEVARTGAARSEARRVGKECVSTRRFRLLPYP